MSDKKLNPESRPAAHAAPRNVKDIPLEERLPDELKPVYLWWKAYGKIASLVLCVVLVLFIGYRYFQRERERKAAEIGLALRDNGEMPKQRIDTLETLAQQYGSTDAGRNAYILLGKAFFDDEQYDKALEAYQHFLDKHGSSNVADIARLGVAASFEAQNKPDDAMTAYDAFLAKAPADYFLRPEAEMGRARCLMLKGDKDAALKLLEETEARYTGTEWSQRIENMRGVIERYIPRAPHKRLSISEHLNLDALKNDAPAGTIDIGEEALDEAEPPNPDDDSNIETTP